MSEFTAKYLADYLPSDFTIDTVNLTVELDDNHTRVTNTLAIKKANFEQNQLILDGEHLKLVSAKINGEQLTSDAFEQTEQQLTIFNVPDEFTLELVTEIDPANNTALEGLYKSGGAFCTQCEAEGFRRITYYLDRPDVMAIFTTKVIADKATYPYLLANGNPVERGELANGKHFVTWHDPFRKPCYLFALVAGDFDLLKDEFVTQSGRSVALEIFVDRGNKHKAVHAMDSLKRSMAWDEQVFGLEYDLDIYMIVAVDFFNMGAMENKGLNVFNSKYVLADKDSATDTDFFNIEAVIAHEYFHNWTGNRVTCRDWFQLSLKEGLTVFRDQQFSADMHSSAVTRIQNVKLLRAQQFAEDAGPMSHPIRPEKVMEMNNFYTLTVYEKGSEVIRMLHTLLGQQGFRQGMDLYFKRFDGMAVTCDDFVDAMADANGKDLSLFKRWYNQSGTPELTVTQQFDAELNKFKLTIVQHTPPSEAQPEKRHLHIPINIELIDPVTQQVTNQLLELTDVQQTWQFDASNQTIVALLGDFSAPVKTHFEQSVEELLSIIELGDNSFCIWDAGQKIMAQEVAFLLANQSAKPSESITRMMAAVMKADYDDEFKALMLTLPSFDELVSGLDKVNPQQLLSAVGQLKLFIAQQFDENLIGLYQTSEQLIQNTDGDTDDHTNESTEGKQVAARSLANTCLSYLSMLSKYHHIIEQQFTQAKEMTSKLGALQSAVRHAPLEVGDKILSQFEQTWLEDTLVMDKWFSLQANMQVDTIFERLEQLMARDDFALTNPNRARSLIGAFAMQNARYFHDAQGKGYQFLAEQIIAMDKINPQVASRLITPLIQFKAFDEHHSGLMIKALELIAAQPELSRDITEKLNAALPQH
ncbi:aminopeptidase N [Thalassotalea euphylliae]|uniref:Aminopeptidase N n=1 Tax=Thalassotalea euphylliae TaxID=1655234 RepID=A0A3E0UJ40_9GAMM|nr:aminopeptidase N [Thalassotalea euphylliae]REL35782.1 aminopeptidase N [Thalassotalea euphylliae]